VGSRVLIGPKTITSDWSLSKVLRLGSDQRLELRAEVFNLFNRANFAVPTNRAIFRAAGQRVATAGVITKTVTPSRQMQFGIKYLF
jgi:hypothetical protein